MVSVIAEIGVNFGGDFTVAKELILQAARAGCWGVKFQYRNLQTFYFDGNEIGDAIIQAEIARNELSFLQITRLQKYANSLGLKFGMSFFRTEDLQFYLKEVDDPDFYKVPSAECMNLPLVDSLLARDRKILISTGGHPLKAVLSQYSAVKYRQIAFLHCIANYPADLGIQNLSKIAEIGRSHEAGYSSHDIDHEVCIAAIALGARWIERHLTKDKNGGGLDDSSSSTESELKLICRFAEQATGIIGAPDAAPNQGEILNMQNLGTGLYLKRDLEIGSKITLADCIIAAPRKGLSVGIFEKKMSGKVIRKKLAKGAPVTAMGMLEPEQILPGEYLDKAKDLRLTIPVRIHDLEMMRQNVGTGNYEFHLSFEEVLSTDIFEVKEICRSNENYSIHLPDYIPGNKIFDPMSSDAYVNELSKKVLARVEVLAKDLEQKTGHMVPIVGSFSQRNGLEHEEFFVRLVSEVIQPSTQTIYPQWLPVNAWYFGGTVKLDVFNNETYLNLIAAHDLKICLDTCHVVLSANSHGANYVDWLTKLMPYAGHIHFADALGEDGEGLPLGTGLPMDYRAMLASTNMKVIEVWQGHFDEGYKFKQAVKFLVDEERGND